MSVRPPLQIALAVLTVLILGLVGYRVLFAAGDEAALVLLEVQGSVTSTDAAGVAAAAVPGTPIDPRHSLVVGADGQAVLGLGEETRLTLSNDSSIRVLGVDGSGVRVELEEGRVQARVRPGSPRLTVSNRGRGVEATDADFTIGADGEGGLQLRADRGAVGLQGLGYLDSLAEGKVLTAVSGKEPVVQDIPIELLLEVEWPDAPATRDAEVRVNGRTDPYARVRLGRGETLTEVRAGADGRFRGSVPLEEGANRLRVEVEDALGNHAEDGKELERDSTAPTVTSTEVLWGG